ncbi:hypothetical protein MPER_02210, partial [Moniliophthora perniciosa FA553]
WSGNGLPSYYLNRILTRIGIKKSFDQLLINGILSIWNLCWALEASFMVERAGRRFLYPRLMQRYAALTGRSRQYASPEPKSLGNPNLDTPLSRLCTCTLLHTISHTPPLIVSYTVEILPYQLRAKGFNVFSFTISLAIIFNQYVNPIALGAPNPPTTLVVRVF